MTTGVPADGGFSGHHAWLVAGVLQSAGGDCSVIKSQCTVRHLISHHLPRRQFSCVIFIPILHTPSISKRAWANLSLALLFVCILSVPTDPLLIFSWLPATREHAQGSQGRGTGNSLHILFQRPISKTNALRACVLAESPVWLKGERPVADTPLHRLFTGKAWGGIRDTNRINCFHHTGPIFVMVYFTPVSLSFLIS